MATFFRSDTTGGTALIHSADAVIYGKVKRAGGNPHVVAPVFVFCSSRNGAPANTGKYTGDEGLYQVLTSNHQILSLDYQPEGDKWDGVIPLAEEGYSVPSARDLIDRFELVRSA